MSLQLRRGLEIYRRTYIPAEGELVYATDSHRLYVGDGSTPGGILITGTSVPPSSPVSPPPVAPYTPPVSPPPVSPPPVSPPPVSPPWTQEETITSNIASPKIRQSFQITIIKGKPNSTFTYRRQGTDNATATLSSSGSSILDFPGIDTAGTYTFDVHFNGSGHDKPFKITITDYEEQVISDAPVYEYQQFNFIFTNCEPGSIVSLERSSDSIDYSLIGILGTINSSGSLTVPYSETAGYWYYRFTFSKTNHTRDLPVQIDSYPPPYDGG